MANADVNTSAQDAFANPLSIDFGLRFDEQEIEDTILRIDINSVHRKMRAINVIASLLHANEVERDTQEPQCITLVQSAGLHDALIELSHDGAEQSEKIGLRLIDLEKGNKPKSSKKNGGA